MATNPDPSAPRSEMLRASPRMFDSPLLDRMSRVHPVVVPLIFAPAIVLTFAFAVDGGVPLGKALLLAAGGWLFWTLTEYWLHRIVFHFEPEDGIGARLHWIIHGVHHDHPNDPMRLVMPPSVSVPLSSLFCLAFIAVLGTDPGLAWSAGFLLGYLMYDMTHYFVHHATPKSRVAKKLRELHMRHHFQDDTKGFGVSAPYWDYVFGTAPRSRRDAGDE